MKIKQLFIGLIGLASLWIGCSENPTKPEYQKEIMIYGNLWGNRPLNQEHAISVKYTWPVDEAYDKVEAAVQNGNVTLTDASSGESWVLRDTDDSPGYYFNEDLVIRPLTTYLLRVEADNQVVTATTTVPPVITLTTDLLQDSLNREYQKNLGFEKPVYVDCECPDDLMIVVDMYCEESWEDARFVNPFFGFEEPESQEDYDGGRNGEPRHIQAFVTYQDLVAPAFENRHTIYWYASMIVFYGRNTMQIMAVDDNYNNYTFAEHRVHSGGVQGGLGLFASMCGETFSLNILEEQP